MRILIGGGMVLAAAIWLAVAAASPRPNPGGPYQIYILDDATQRSTYAIAMYDRAAAAQVQNCVGSLLDQPADVVADIRRRLGAKGFDVVTVDGEGSSVELGRCEDHENVARQHDGENSLVLVRNASAAQARSIIHEIHGLSLEQRQTMIAALGLDQRSRVRR